MLYKDERVDQLADICYVEPAVRKSRVVIGDINSECIILMPSTPVACRDKSPSIIEESVSSAQVSNTIRTMAYLKRIVQNERKANIRIRVLNPETMQKCDDCRLEHCWINVFMSGRREIDVEQLLFQ